MMLPAGFYDVLSPEADAIAAATETLLKGFADYGYGRVSPPMMEFEETLLSGPGATLNRTTFRVMDPASQRMLACRSDHTLQIGRIATTRLHDAPRPLRLSYAGPILRLAGGQQNHARQMTQVGAELIGSLDAAADAEVILLAFDGLARLKIEDVAVDLTLPTLIPSLIEAYGLSQAAHETLLHALARKDEAALQTLSKGEGGKVAALALSLMRACGAPKDALAALEKMQLPEKAALDRTRLSRVIALLPARVLGRASVDLVEYRGFEYQTGLSFALFSRAARAELGRGGRYRTASNEPATGFTFYAESLMPVLPPLPARQVKEVPFATSAEDAQRLIAQGFVVVRKLG